LVPPTQEVWKGPFQALKRKALEKREFGERFGNKGPANVKFFVGNLGFGNKWPLANPRKLGKGICAKSKGKNPQAKATRLKLRRAFKPVN